MGDNAESRVELRGAEADIEPVSAELDRCAECWDIPQETLFKVQIALDELVSNVLRHGHRDGAEPAIDVVIRWNGEALEVEILDDGPAFNPLESPNPKFDDNVATAPIGGLGIFMVRELMDSVSYCREDGKNCVKVCKRADA